MFLIAHMIYLKTSYFFLNFVSLIFHLLNQMQYWWFVHSLSIHDLNWIETILLLFVYFIYNRVGNWLIGCHSISQQKKLIKNEKCAILNVIKISTSTNSVYISAVRRIKKNISKEVMYIWVNERMALTRPMRNVLVLSLSIDEERIYFNFFLLCNILRKKKEL